MGLEILKSCIHRSQQLEGKRVMGSQWEAGQGMAMGWGSRRCQSLQQTSLAVGPQENKVGISKDRLSSPGSGRGA